MDWRHGLVIGLVAAVALLSAVLLASGFGVEKTVTILALVLVPVAATVGAFLLVWRFVWRLDEDGAPLRPSQPSRPSRPLRKR